MVQLKQSEEDMLEVIKCTLCRVTDKGQIVIPTQLRKKYHIKKGSKLRVEETKGGILILPPLLNELAEDPVEKSRGILKGKTSLL